MSAAMIPAFERTPTTVDGMRAVNAQWPIYARMMARIAGSITKDPDDRNDLIQSALVEFWEIDATRIDRADRGTRETDEEIPTGLLPGNARKFPRWPVVFPKEHPGDAATDASSRAVRWHQKQTAP